MKKPKPVTLTKRQIDNLLDALFNIDTPVVPRVKMSGPVYDYAWTVWAKRRDIRALQGERAHRRSLRETIVVGNASLGPSNDTGCEVAVEMLLAEQLAESLSLWETEHHEWRIAEWLNVLGHQDALDAVRRKQDEGQ